LVTFVIILLGACIEVTESFVVAVLFVLGILFEIVKSFVVAVVNVLGIEITETFLADVIKLFGDFFDIE
jgi:hypothetical protein